MEKQEIKSRGVSILARQKVTHKTIGFPCTYNVSLRAGVSEQARCVKGKAKGVGECSSVVSDEVNVSVLGAELLLPGLDSEEVVDSDDVDGLFYGCADRENSQ